MTLIKKNLIENIYFKYGQSKRTSTTLVESLLEIMKKTLESGEDVMISSFGKFCVKKKGDRRGRNPQTGDNMMMGAKRVVLFRCSPVLKERANEE